MKQKLLQAMFAVLLIANANAQVNSGSNGSDGALDYSALNNPPYNITIDMHDHLNGIYQYTYVKIPSGVTITFTPNANNTPVTWLVQSNVVINGTVDVSGQPANGSIGGIGGPGGWMGGSGSSGGNSPGSGQGPGGGPAGTGGGFYGAGSAGDGSYGTQGGYSPSGIIMVTPF